MFDRPPLSEEGFTVLILAATLLFLIKEYGLSPMLWTPRFMRRGLPESEAQARAVLLHRFAGGLLMGLGSVAVLLGLGLSPVQHGLALRQVGSSLPYLAIAAAVILPVVALSSRSPGLQVHYPEIRAQRVSRDLALLSAAGWVVYLVGYELLFRGLVLFGCANVLDTMAALAVMTSIYTLAHLNKSAGECFGSVPMGFVFGGLTLLADSILPAVILHCGIALTSEWMSAKLNPSMHWWGMPGADSVDSATERN